MNEVLRQEVFTRTKFAYDQAQINLKKINSIKSSGNILQSKYTRKFLQCVRINDYYNEEFNRFVNPKK